MVSCWRNTKLPPPPIHTSKSKLFWVWFSAAAVNWSNIKTNMIEYDLYSRLCARACGGVVRRFGRVVVPCLVPLPLSTLHGVDNNISHLHLQHNSRILSCAHK